jgi:predicted DsbA family dithiol-disulfide isomerase
MGTVRVEIWSDVVCPWCYIGKRRFERALEQFPHRDTIEIRYRSFQLDPDAAAFDPRAAPRDLATYLGTRYGGGREAGLRMLAHVTGIAAAEGLVFDLEHARGGNTLDAHRVLHAAHRAGGPLLQGEVKERLLRGYFCEREDIGDPQTLVRLGADAGLGGELAREALADDTLRADVLADQAQARAFGVTGVPFFVLDRRLGVSGAQQVQVFADVLARAWADLASAGDAVPSHSE